MMHEQARGSQRCKSARRGCHARVAQRADDDRLQATVNEESKGFYKAGFVVKHTGIYEVFATAEGKPIKGVPFKCEVAPGKPDFTKCKLGGQGLQAVRLGQPCDVLIELYDIFSNRITSALDALSDVQVCPLLQHTTIARHARLP
jgi:hypothetical protein